MKYNSHSYDVFPRIVRAHSTTQITIRPLFDHTRFHDGCTYRVALVPLEWRQGETRLCEPTRFALQPQNGEMRVACHFFNEQEYRLIVEQANEQGQPETLLEIRLYALADDLFVRCPYKGDTHMHTNHSDGVESPAYVAARCRQIGMDFIAITDHRQYSPSLEAICAFEKVPTNLRIFPGEEIHPPENRVHMVNFGGSFSINALFAEDCYRAEVADLAASITGLAKGIDPYSLASCMWCFNKIRQGGGLGIFCHPYWLHQGRLDVSGTLTDVLIERQPFDALELIGGYQTHEMDANTLQVARYHEERAGGRQIPIVGASDSHGVENGRLFGWYYTIVFSPTLDLADLVSSVKDLYSVAVEALPNQLVRPYGPFRLVRYALFLIEEIFPLHDDLCVEEGRLMLAHAAGDVSAAAGLLPLHGRTERLYTHLWAG
jgi:hypothetical protein